MPLPAGWQPRVDSASGNTYFWNTFNDSAQWERPTEHVDPRSTSLLMLRQAASAAAAFVRCPESVGSVAGYDFREGSNGPGYYRRSDAPPANDREYSRVMLIRASAAGASFVACPASVGELPGYDYQPGAQGLGYYLRPGQRDVAYQPPPGEKDSSPGGPSAAASAAPAEEVAEWLKKNEVELSEGCPPPVLTFAAAPLLPALVLQLQAAGFTAPTPIQSASWPPAVAGRDVIAIAKTGSGKTLGYLAPAIGRIASDSSCLVMCTPAALVLAPTRELATQIGAECARFGAGSGIASVCLYGGAPRAAQLAELQKGVHLIVATPGRLNDFINAGQVDLDEVAYAVLDEADRMLDMGFEPQIREVLRQVPRRRQTLMYSATWPKGIGGLAADFLRAPCTITIGGSGEALVANQDVEQHIVFLSPGMEAQRDARLAQQIRRQPDGARILVFCSTKRTCELVARALRGQGVPKCATIHSDKDQGERDLALADFKAGGVPVLVATDVAARGLDIEGVGMVVNYELPGKIEDYVHRIGRTGRAGAKGCALSFMGAADAKHAPAIVKLLQDAGQKPPVELAKMAQIMGGAAAGASAGGKRKAEPAKGLYDF